MVVIFCHYYQSQQSLFFEIDITKLNHFLFVIGISSVSQIGDIIISYFKRLSKIKDTGKIIPGHGGLLDRADGMIFAFPFALIVKLSIIAFSNVLFCIFFTTKF